MTRGEFDRAVAEAPRLVQPAEQQSRTTQCLVRPPDDTEVSPRHVTLGELLAFPEPGQRLARLADLRESPGGRGDPVGEVEDDVPCPERCEPVLDQCARLRPVPLDEVKPARADVGEADGVRTLRRVGQPERLGLVLGCLGESAKFGEAR